MRKAIVDVDSILWDFQAPLKQIMRDMFPNKTIPDEFETWDHPGEFFDNFDDMISVFDGIHSRQEQASPFSGAYRLLQTLCDKGYRVHIASNRRSCYRESLVNWLDMNGLLYDAVFASKDKTVLFGDPSIDILIDDKPSTQELGVRNGYLVITLEYKYNRNVEGTYKFGTLSHMTDFINKSVRNLTVGV